MNNAPANPAPVLRRGRPRTRRPMPPAPVKFDIEVLARAIEENTDVPPGFFEVIPPDVMRLINAVDYAHYCARHAEQQRNAKPREPATQAPADAPIH
ncbi:MAG TPA: hypothetical protein VHP33_03245 [Polyangiaceae bacterium]|nr:hypothetical protein [Polyangiaceae bacterium]